MKKWCFLSESSFLSFRKIAILLSHFHCSETKHHLLVIQILFQQLSKWIAHGMHSIAPIIFTTFSMLNVPFLPNCICYCPTVAEPKNVLSVRSTLHGQCGLRATRYTCNSRLHELQSFSQLVYKLMALHQSTGETLRIRETYDEEIR